MTWNSRLTEKEDYVSFKTAKLLYDKGFRELTYFSYDSNGVIVVTYWEWIEGTYPRCTLQMAMKWLREVYHIHIRLINSSDESYRYEIYPREGKYRSSCFSDRRYYESYEQACEEAIKYILENLIIDENPTK